MWNTLGQAATVAQLVGADVGGLISMIIQAAVTAQQNKKECEQLARRVFTIGELLQHLQDPEVLRRPELRRPLAGLGDTLREAHELVMACQDRSAVYRLVLAGRQAERFRDVQSKIDSYLFVFPIISHLDITRRLDRIYNILVPNDTAGPATSSAFSMSQIAVQESHLQDAPRIDSTEPYEVQVFTFKELAKATNNFDPDKKIGHGGFGPVYMGSLPDGREVAIKRRDKSSPQGVREFLRELNVLSSVSHKHIVRLFGCCVPEKRQLLPMFRKKKNEFLIVYEYLENRSLSQLLYSWPSPSPSPVTTSWRMRIEIVLGVSRAIEYLQSYSDRPVIYRDVKLSNILLDANWMPHLSDFGFALTWEGPDHEDIVCGTLGYLDPEYAMTGILNPKIDVYSFGVVMLEVLTGRTAYSSHEKWVEIKREACEEEEREACGEEKRDECKEKVQRDKREEESGEDNFADILYSKLVDFAVPLIEAGELWKVLDMRPAGKPTSRQLEAVELVAQAAVRCVRMQWKDRPSISEVVATLEAALELARCDG